MEPVFAHFMVHLEWPHRGHAQLDKLKSKTDVWTYAKKPHGMPQGQDRMVLLFLLAQALQNQRARFRMQDMADWFQCRWTKRSLLTRLQRVLAVRFRLPVCESPPRKLRKRDRLLARFRGRQREDRIAET